jgi:hypothetical protein
MLDIVVHDAYCDLQSLYHCSYPTQTGLRLKCLLHKTCFAIIIWNQSGKKKCMSSHWLSSYHAKWRLCNWIPCLIVLYMMHIVTYKFYTSARILRRQVWIETGCSKEHVTLLSLVIKVESRNACEFSLTAIPCEMKGNSLDTMFDILVVHDAYCDLHSLYLCSHSSQRGLGWNWLLDRTWHPIIIRNQSGK